MATEPSPQPSTRCQGPTHSKHFSQTRRVQRPGIYAITSCGCDCQLSFHGVLIALNVLTFFLNVAALHGLSGCLLDERQQSLLSLDHESVEVIGSQERRIDEMRCEIGVKFRTIDRGRSLIAFFQLCKVLGRRDSTNNSIGPVKQRRLINDGIENTRLDAMLLTPVLRKYVMDIDIFTEKYCEVEFLS